MRDCLAVLGIDVDLLEQPRSLGLLWGRSGPTSSEAVPHFAGTVTLAIAADRYIGDGLSG